MEIFTIIVSLFVIGSVTGWIIEVLFRRFFSQKRWMNPGFLTGPYLPVYGFGVIALYGLSEIINQTEFSTSVPLWLNYLLIIIFIGIILVVIEFIAGLIFIKGFGLKLWDYSNRKGNTMGIICPLFDLLWTIAGAIYYFFIHPVLSEGILWLCNHEIYFVFTGMVLGMIIVDFFYSMHVATIITKFTKTNKVIVRLTDIQRQISDNKNKKFTPVLVQSDLKEVLSSHLEDFKARFEEEKQRRKKKKTTGNTQEVPNDSTSEK